MKISVQTPGVKARKSILELIDSKMKKLGDLNERLIEASVCIKLNKSNTTENKICEIIIHVPGSNLFVEKHARTFPEAVRKGYEAMRRMIDDWKSTTRPYRKSRALNKD